jgi:hypothetical protein
MSKTAKCNLKVFLPADLLSAYSSQEQKTVLLGTIARYCAIFKVKDLVFFDEGDTWKQKAFDIQLLQDVLQYIATPQYLRRGSFSKVKTLTSAGLLPPLNTPNHPVEKEPLDIQLEKNDVIFRRGQIENIKENTTFINIGLDQPLEMAKKPTWHIGDIVDIRITKNDNKIETEQVSPEDIPEYWGFTVRYDERPINEILDEEKPENYTIATSKWGIDYRSISLPEKLEKEPNKRGLSLFFGPREKGLSKLLGSVDELFKKFDQVINFIPEPGTKSIRLEEAIPIVLALTCAILSD